MKRWFLILLIALLPMQFSWAAVCAYCGDEDEAASENALHAKKACQDEATSNRDAASAHGTGNVLDDGADCGNHCHGHLTSVPVAEAPTVLNEGHDPAVRAGVILLVGTTQLRPERPQWHALA